MKSGFETNPIGYTGVFCGSKNPQTNDCFWMCRIVKEDGDNFLVELMDGGNKGYIKKTDFSPIFTFDGETGELKSAEVLK